MGSVVNRISRKDFLKILRSESHYVLLNIQDEDEFEKEHIPGSINIPLGKIKKLAPEKFNIDDKILVYCNNSDNCASEAAANMLFDLGFTNSFDYKGGLDDYKKSKQPLVGKIHEYKTDNEYYDAMLTSDEYFNYLNFNYI